MIMKGLLVHPLASSLLLYSWITISAPPSMEGKSEICFPKAIAMAPPHSILTKPSVSGFSPNSLCTHALSRNGRVEALTKPSKSVTASAEN